MVISLLLFAVQDKTRAGDRQAEQYFCRLPLSNGAYYFAEVATSNLLKGPNISIFILQMSSHSSRAYPDPCRLPAL